MNTSLFLATQHRRDWRVACSLYRGGGTFARSYHSYTNALSPFHQRKVDKPPDERRVSSGNGSDRTVRRPRSRTARSLPVNALATRGDLSSSRPQAKSEMAMKRPSADRIVLR